MRQSAPTDIKGPMSTWEKIKSGVKGFVKTTLHYLPRGIAFSAILMGGSALLGHAVGWDPLHMLSDATTTDTVTHIAKRLGMTLLLGSAISGGVGAWQEIQHDAKQRDEEIEAQSEQLKRGRGQTPQRQQMRSENPPMEIETPKGLPVIDTAVHLIH